MCTVTMQILNQMNIMVDVFYKFGPKFQRKNIYIVAALSIYPLVVQLQETYSSIWTWCLETPCMYLNGLDS